MLRVREVKHIVAGVAVAAAISGGCREGGGSATAKPPSSDVGATTDSDPGAPTPLEAFLGTSYPSETRRRVGEVDRARQEHLAHCLQARGWTYEPIDFSAANLQTGDGADLPEDEYMTRSGYGYSESLTSTVRGPVGALIDPNQERESTLTGASRIAYEEAKGKCFEDAVRRYPDPTTVPRELRQDVDDLRKRIANDARVRDAERQWAACMADAGFHFEDRQALFEELERRVAPLRAARDASGPGPASGSIAGLEDFRRYELAVAAADVSCKRELDRVSRSVRREVEERYLKEHGDRIAVLRGER